MEFPAYLKMNLRHNKIQIKAEKGSKNPNIAKTCPNENPRKICYLSKDNSTII
jgi:hypothetical protein